MSRSGPCSVKSISRLIEFPLYFIPELLEVTSLFVYNKPGPTGPGLFCCVSGAIRLNNYRGKHSTNMPWAVSSTASVRYRSRHQLKNRRRRRGRIVLVVLVVILLLLPFLDPLWIREDKVSLTSEDLPEGIGHLRVVYLSDLHYGFFFSQSRVNSLVNQINNLKPDIVIFGGDMGDSAEEAIKFYRNLPSIHARYALLGVLGDYDHGADTLERTAITDAMRDADVTPLVNDVAAVRVGTSSVYVAGLDMPEGSYTTALTSLAAKTSESDFVIFTCHTPAVVSEAQRVSDANGSLGWYDLALFGHTHGGQIKGLSGFLDIASDVDSHYLSGWLVENRATILVSNGVGTSVIPARVFCPAQIHCIDISVP